MIAVLIIITILFLLIMMNFMSNYVFEGFTDTCKDKCVKPTKQTSNCRPYKYDDPDWDQFYDNITKKDFWKNTNTNSSNYNIISYTKPSQIIDNSKMVCPWNCSNTSLNVPTGTCAYNSECSTCEPHVIFTPTADEYSTQISGEINLSGTTGSTGTNYSANDGTSYSSSSGATGATTDEYDTEYYNHYNSSNITGYDEDNYILKTRIVPPICPACPNIEFPDSTPFDKENKIKKENCVKKCNVEKTEEKPAEKTEAKYYNDYPNTPYPILPDFTTFGI